MSVHVIGKIRFVDDVALENILQKVSLQFENGIESSPTTFNQLPSDFKKKMLPMIVGFEIEIAKIDHVFKLSQDRDKESYLNIIKHLKERDHKSKSIARQMEMRTKNLFK